MSAIYKQAIANTKTSRNELGVFWVVVGLVFLFAAVLWHFSSYILHSAAELVDIVGHNYIPFYNFTITWLHPIGYAGFILTLIWLGREAIVYAEISKICIRDELVGLTLKSTHSKSIHRFKYLPDDLAAKARKSVIACTLVVAISLLCFLPVLLVLGTELLADFVFISPAGMNFLVTFSVTLVFLAGLSKCFLFGVYEYLPNIFINDETQALFEGYLHGNPKQK